MSHGGRASLRWGGGGGFTQTCRAELRAAASPALVGQQYSWSLSRSLKYTDS